eukprot:ANDGO_05983.mRNA.1 Endoplasmin homolog
MLSKRLFLLFVVVALVPLLAHPGAAETDSSSGSTRYEFQAEVSRLLNLIINSLYTKKEIFLRELISNASDALDKIRFLSLKDSAALGSGEQAKLEIRIEADKANRMLYITDTGIGMTRQDLVDSLGTIASSGTKKFLDVIAEGSGSNSGEMNLIGQFGVGFYSVYLVADKVVVASKHNDDVQLLWESTADNGYTITVDPQGNTLGRGTRIAMHLTEDASEFLEEYKLRDLVKRYSEFINFPILLRVSKEVEKEVPDFEADSEEVDAEGEKVEKTKKVKETEFSWEQVNNLNPIWTRNPKEVQEEEYQAFYKALTKEYDNATSHIHFKAEGDVSFRSILYIPGRGPSDVGAELGKAKSAVKLFVRRVFISDDIEDLLPRYLAFLRGLVDSDDLPLNVSREFLQQSKLIRLIKKKLVRKALEMIKQLADKENRIRGVNFEDEKEEDSEAEDKQNSPASDDADKKDRPYTRFWKDFGVFLRVGVIEDTANRNRLAKLLRYQTTRSVQDAQDAKASVDEADYVSFAEYVSRMKKGQKSIYYIAGTHRDELLRSPLLEELKSRNLEVLLLTEPVDEYMLQSYTEFEGHKLQDVSKEGLKLEGDDEEAESDVLAREAELKAKFEPLTSWFTKVLGSEKVTSAVVSSRVRKSPCVLVSAQWGMTANMERIMKAQALNDQSNKMMKARRILEINPYHPVISTLLERVQADSENEDTKELGTLLYETASLQSGFDLEDPIAFAQRIHKVINLGLSLHPDVTVTDDDIANAKEAALQKGRERKAREESVKKEEETFVDDIDVDSADDAKDEL